MACTVRQYLCCAGMQYDPDWNEQYWMTRPVSVTKRLITIGTSLLYVASSQLPFLVRQDAATWRCKHPMPAPGSTAILHYNNTTKKPYKVYLAVCLSEWCSVWADQE